MPAVLLPCPEDAIADTVTIPCCPTLIARQRDLWASGSCAVVETTPQIVDEELCGTQDLRARKTLLDVAAGNDNATLAAADDRIPSRRRMTDPSRLTPATCAQGPRAFRFRTTPLMEWCRPSGIVRLPPATGGTIAVEGLLKRRTGQPLQLNSETVHCKTPKDHGCPSSDRPLIRPASADSRKRMATGCASVTAAVHAGCATGQCADQRAFGPGPPQGVRRQGACACAADRPNGGAVQRTVVVTAATGTSGKRQHDCCSHQPKSGFHVLPLGFVLVCPESVPRSIGDDNPGTLQERVMVMAAGP